MKFQGPPAEVMLKGDNGGVPSWRASEEVERWQRGLLHITGCSPLEIAARLSILLQFCSRQSVSPARMIDECRYCPDRNARRNFYLKMARNSPANLVVQSFLVHNGINIFGDLICVPHTAQAVIREQGEQWVSRQS